MTVTTETRAKADQRARPRGRGNRAPRTRGDGNAADYDEPMRVKKVMEAACCNEEVARVALANSIDDLDNAVTKALALTKEDEWHEVKSKSQQRHEREAAARREQQMQCERSRAGGNSTTPLSRAVRGGGGARMTNGYNMSARAQSRNTDQGGVSSCSVAVAPRGGGGARGVRRDGFVQRDGGTRRGDEQQTRRGDGVNKSSAPGVEQATSSIDVEQAHTDNSMKLNGIVNGSVTTEPPRVRLGYAQVVRRGVDAERRRQAWVQDLKTTHVGAAPREEQSPAAELSLAQSHERPAKSSDYDSVPIILPHPGEPKAPKMLAEPVPQIGAHATDSLKDNAMAMKTSVQCSETREKVPSTVERRAVASESHQKVEKNREMSSVAPRPRVFFAMDMPSSAWTTSVNMRQSLPLPCVMATESTQTEPEQQPRQQLSTAISALGQKSERDVATETSIIAEEKREVVYKQTTNSSTQVAMTSTGVYQSPVHTREKQQITDARAQQTTKTANTSASTAANIARTTANNESRGIEPDRAEALNAVDAIFNKGNRQSHAPVVDTVQAATSAPTTTALTRVAHQSTAMQTVPQQVHQQQSMNATTPNASYAVPPHYTIHQTYAQGPQVPAPYLSQQIDQHSQQQAMLNMQQSQQAISNMQQQSQQAMSSMQQPPQQVPQHHHQHAMGAHPQHMHVGQQAQYMQQSAGMWNQYSSSPQPGMQPPSGDVMNGDDMQQYQQNIMGYNQYIGTPYGVMMAPDASGRTVPVVPQMGDGAGYYHAGDFHAEQPGASGGMMMNVANKQHANDSMANAYAQMSQARPRAINDAHATMHNDRLPTKDAKRQVQSIYKHAGAVNMQAYGGMDAAQMTGQTQPLMQQQYAQFMQPMHGHAQNFLSPHVYTNMPTMGAAHGSADRNKPYVQRAHQYQPSSGGKWS